MTTFRVAINLGNDAMNFPADIAEALENVVEYLYTVSNADFEDTNMAITDVNGNRVGNAYLGNSSYAELLQ